jgi:signal transduction histidine kinase/CheY-like chemotaxis protein
MFDCSLFVPTLVVRSDSRRGPLDVQSPRLIKEAWRNDAGDGRDGASLAFGDVTTANGFDQMNGADGEIEALRRENDKLRKINAALMSRVERAMNQPSNAFALFEVAISLDATVRRRTAELQSVLRSVERANDALKRAKQRAEEANSSKSTFLAYASHDLLQPLNAAKLGLSALGEAPPHRDWTALVRQADMSLSNLEELIRTLLDISKLDAGVMRPKFADFPIESALAPLREEFRALAASRGLGFKVRPSKAWVRSDPLLLRRVLQNLINNALRYTRKGGVLIGCRRRGDSLRIEISDTGLGIPEDRREAIFDEFQREPSTSGADGGFGLGLSIVRRLSQALEHPIDLASRVGAGSTFAVSLPLVAETDRKRGAHGVELTPSAPPFAGVEVQLVENQAAIDGAMRALLRRWGCSTSSAASSAEAVAAARARGQAPRLIIADLHLDGGERGFDAIEALRAAFGAVTPAFLITADPSDAGTSVEASGGLEVLRKPVRPAELRSLMAYLLR